MRKLKTIPKEFSSNDVGIHNGQIDQSQARLIKGNSYKDLSTIWITPTRGQLKCRVISSWMALIKPMNQPVTPPIFIEGQEVGKAYSDAFEMILNHPELSKWKYILTVEEDNLPPADGLLKLYESIEKGYDVVAGIYWTKGEIGQPMIYGDPKVFPRNFVPQVPLINQLQHCNGLGMGFNLWKISSLKNKLKEMPRPWFRTLNEPGRSFTQDLWFYNEAAKYGFKVACDTSIKVGHLDNNGIVW